MGSESSPFPMPIAREINRDDFPKDFVFGCATSAYQVEGAHLGDGRDYSIWDVYSNGYPGNILDGSNGNVAVDMYNRYKEDIKMMKAMGFDAYRFSISWSRIIPGGKISLGVNQEGIKYYNDLINTVIENGLKPYVTLFHWDLPYLLEQQYGGFLSEKIVDDFRDFVELCFWEFGDRVRHWITINEAWTYAAHGYANRTFPPGNGFYGPQIGPYPVRPQRHEEHGMHDENYDIDEDDEHDEPEEDFDDDDEHDMADENADGSDDEGQNFIPYRGCRVEKETTRARENNTVVLRKLWCAPKVEDPEKAKEAYTVGRNLLLCHAAAVKSYRDRFQKHQKGKIGITNNIHWFEPFHDTYKDRKAARRAFDFMLGWFLEPVLIGQYPKNMRDFVPRDRLRPFSKEESELLRGSVDFVGINYYTAWYATDDPNPDAEEGYNKDQRVKFKYVKNGKPIGESTGSSWLYIVPWGFHKLLKFLKDTYQNGKYNLPPIYITENGCDQVNDPMQTPYEACRDAQRVNYFRDHLRNLMRAIIVDKVNVKAYFAWSFCDNFEWYDGYRSRFGLLYIDYKNGLTRYRKDSAIWFNHFLHSKKVVKNAKKTF